MTKLEQRRLLASPRLACTRVKVIHYYYINSKLEIEIG